MATRRNTKSAGLQTTLALLLWAVAIGFVGFILLSLYFGIASNLHDFFILLSSNQ
jgi:hypothetical protein